MQVNISNREFVILNVYAPYESRLNEEEYLNRLAFISSFIYDHMSTNIFIMGDMNADISDCNSLFARHMLQLCDDNNLILSSEVLLPADSFTSVSEAWHSTSWLDHCISTADTHASISSMEILYDASMSDHGPFVLIVECECLPESSQEAHTACTPRLDWSKLTSEDVLLYYGRADKLLNNISLREDAILCTDLNCNLNAHYEGLSVMYDCIVGVLIEAGKPCLSLNNNNNRHKPKPGWNKHVADHHSVAKKAHKAWVLAGRPREGTGL